MLNVDYVQEIMDDHGWTLGQLSSKSGLSKAQFSCLFRDKRHAGAKTMEGILRAFPEADRDCYFLQRLLPISNIFGINQTETAKEKERLITARPGRREIMNRSY